MSVKQYEVGSVVAGKVTGIKPFGAFVALEGGKQGLVHISEVAHAYVKDIHDVLSVGDEVNVKIKKIDAESGKISLSIRDAQPAPERRKGKQERGFNTLEDKLKDWLKQSNEIHADLNKRARR